MNRARIEAEKQRRAEELRAKVAAHKLQIREQRRQLAKRKSELVALERECAARGIRLIHTGEGGTHGHEDAEQARGA